MAHLRYHLSGSESHRKPVNRTVAETLRVSPELFSREEELAWVGEVLILWPGALVAYVGIEIQMSTGLSDPASCHT